MKIKRQFRNEENRFEVYFCYEDYYGGTKFGSYEEMMSEGEMPNLENRYGTLVGFLHSHYWGTTERIDIMNLRGKPTISEIKEFIINCYRVLDLEF